MDPDYSRDGDRFLVVHKPRPEIHEAYPRQLDGLLLRLSLTGCAAGSRPAERRQGARYGNHANLRHVLPSVFLSAMATSMIAFLHLDLFCPFC